MEQDKDALKILQGLVYFSKQTSVFSRSNYEYASKTVKIRVGCVMTDREQSFTYSHVHSTPLVRFYWIRHIGEPETLATYLDARFSSIHTHVHQPKRSEE